MISLNLTTEWVALMAMSSVADGSADCCVTTIAKQPDAKAKCLLPALAQYTRRGENSSPFAPVSRAARLAMQSRP